LLFVFGRGRHVRYHADLVLVVRHLPTVAGIIEALVAGLDDLGIRVGEAALPCVSPAIGLR